jgi:hypothetical protein
MPDFWESQYGLNPAVSNAATADADGDGMFDYKEYISGTIPNNGASLLELTELVPGTNAVVTFPTVPFRNYNLESTSVLTSPANWRVVFTNVLGTGGDKVLVDVAPTSGISYRARAIVP